LLRDYKKRFGFRLFAWAILPNHAHMLIQVGETPLSKIMQGIQQSFTGRYNHFHNRTGHVFEQRYKAFLCSEAADILRVIHYIHHNPRRAGMAGGIDNPYSSHRDYRWRSAEALTDTEYIHQLISPDMDKAVQEYQELMSKEILHPVDTRPVRGRGLGYIPGLARMETGVVDLDFEELLSLCAGVMGVSRADIVGRSRQRDFVLARWVLVKFCLEYTRHNQRDIARVLGSSVSAVSKAGLVTSAEVSEGVKRLVQLVEKRPDPN
jgi:hypothetical protein